MNKKLILICTLMLACGVAAFGFAGCAEEEKRSPYGQMADYYSIEEVKSFHKEIGSLLNETIEALDSEDAKKLEKALDELDEMCDLFLDVKDVPEALVPYHEKMLEVAKIEKRYASALRTNDYEAAADELGKTFDLLKEAQALLPEKE